MKRSREQNKNIKKDTDEDTLGKNGSYELRTYDPDGSDLRVEPWSERLAFSLYQKEQAEKIGGEDGQLLMMEASERIENLRREAKVVRDNLDKQLEDMSEQDMLYAHAVQDWTLSELEKRAEDRGYEYDMTDERTYRETIDVLDNLVDELINDGEDEKIITLAETWQQEIRADLDVNQVEETYATFMSKKETPEELLRGMRPLLDESSYDSDYDLAA